jgi:ubiquinone/menaquinone biosynthesis C-methylase UbiE
MNDVRPNDQQIEYWNEQGGPRWVHFKDLLDAQLHPLGLAVIDRAAPASGSRVLDVGCGCGDTSLELARRVGEAGHVVGADISAPMLARAREVACEAGLTNVAFEEADCQIHDFGAGVFDRVVSRFGVMFFADPVAAFTNLRTATAPSGEMVFICWQAPHNNPWMMVPMMAAMQHITMDAPPNPQAPGPFAFANADRVRGILTDAGWSDIVIDDHRCTLNVGGSSISLEEAADFMLHLGPTARALIGQEDDVRSRVAEAVREALRPFHGASGLEMDGACWLVTARKA